MRTIQWVVMILLGASLLAGGVSVGGAQDEPRPLVVVVEGRRPLETAAMTNIGPAGISQLADLFRQLGARVQFARLDSPLPPEARVVIVVRPLRSLRLREAVYLWQHLARGGNLLLALDPEEFFLGGRNVRPRYNRSGLGPLIAQDFGLTVTDAFLAELWYSGASIQSLDTTYSLAFAELNGESLTAPLAQYGVPVWLWGARRLVVDPLGPYSQATPLLATRTAYAETEVGIFRTSAALPAAPLRYDAGKDQPAGLFTVGARAIKTASGARIALLGDSELLQNGYGLVRDGAIYRYPGNAIFAGRLAAWLLGLPEDQWPALPVGWTWLALDGDPADWEGRALAPVADERDAVSGVYDLAQAAAFADDRYLYLLVRTHGVPDATMWLEVTRDDGAKLRFGAGDVLLTGPDGVQTVVPDAALTTGAVIEARIPLRVAGTRRALTTVCLGVADTPLDCLGQALPVSAVQTRAPSDALWEGHMLATIHSTAGVYLRRGPSTSTPIQTTLRAGTTMAAVGRTADSAWIQVQDARYTGWVAAYLLTPGGDFSTLPVVDRSSG